MITDTTLGCRKRTPCCCGTVFRLEVAGVAFCEPGLPSPVGAIVSDLFFDVGLGLAVVPGVEMTQGTADGTIPCGRPSNSAWYGETWVLWGLS